METPHANVVVCFLGHLQGKVCREFEKSLILLGALPVP
jgi:hypothetical protein